MTVRHSDEAVVTLPSGIDLCYDTFGDPADPTVLLVMGLGAPMGWWTPAFCSAVAEAGHFVVRYDNRDTGASSTLEGRVRTRDLLAAFVGRGTAPPYTLHDMADDALGLLDHLGVEQFHAVGISMGGMIAQSLAINAPHRVRSLTSIMSTTGARSVGYQHPKMILNLLRPAGTDRDAYVAASARGQALLGSPDYPVDAEVLAKRAGETWDRGWTAGGVLRQMLAILHQGDRTRALQRLRLPATVIHGLDDPLVDPSGGRATSRAIRGSELLMIRGMGHEMPTVLTPVFVDAISRTVARADHTDQVDVPDPSSPSSASRPSSSTSASSR